MHITSQEAWDSAKENGKYEAPSLQTEGFIHLSKRNQVNGTLNLFYPSADSVLLLFVCPSKLENKLVFEAPTGNHDRPDTFPHVYGHVNLDAVVHTQSLTKSGNTWDVSIETPN